MNIGQTLYQYRRERGFNQRERAAGVVTPSFYSKVERGASRITAEDFYLKISSLCA
ncbi:MAG: hypothetical protein Q4A55_06935 [Aerococcus sp.]|nr:hypothetical protein [Aerococcus sp.]